MGEEDRLAEIVADWLERRRQGEYLDPEEAIAEHHDLAETPSLEESLPARIGEYEVHEELGSGGMVTVYLASPERELPGLRAGDRVALKVIHGHLLAKPGGIGD